MQPTHWMEQQARRSLERLLPRFTPILKGAKDSDVFLQRLHKHFPRLFASLYQLYGDQYDFFYHLEHILERAAHNFKDRPAALKKLDKQREANPKWFQSENMVGAVCYVDLFAGDLSALQAKIPYFQELGITYLHLMPLFKAPDTNNDGGYAVSDYRTVNSQLGTMQELAALATELRQHGISLVLDFIFNHTSDEHIWAQKALSGDEEYQNYYYMFPNRDMPNQYEATLREIFPQQAPGNFTHRPEIDKWVWTSFYNFQWDLNYKNPAVFNAMLDEMLFLANQGVEVIRLDAVAFIWKQLGTASENLPQAHLIIQAYNALIQIVAPALLFKSEAIVHPDDVMAYISPQEAPLSYNPTLMALIWESLATRKVELLRQSMAKRFELPFGTSWVNYIRVHDDIGWTFADEDAAELGINGYDHRKFLNGFYIGEFPSSFATGLPFNHNEKTGDMRISGTAASLAGLEKAIKHDDPHQIDLALKRLQMMVSIILSIGGIPLLYLGDEIATTNDYGYRGNPEKAEDSRWVHRPKFDWHRANAERQDPETITGRMFLGLQKLIQIRKQHPIFADGRTIFFDTQNPYVFGYVHNRHLLVLCNFSEQHQAIEHDVLNAYITMSQSVTDLILDEPVAQQDAYILPPYAFKWWLSENTMSAIL